MYQHDHSGLVDVLTEQVQCVDAMLLALERENHALLENDAETLNAAGADKNRLLETLESLEHERQGLAANDASFEQLIADDVDAKSSWQQLVERLEECRRRNQRNGALVNARQEQIAKMLIILRGVQTEVYDSHGQKPAAPAARSLGSA